MKVYVIKYRGRDKYEDVIMVTSSRESAEKHIEDLMTRYEYAYTDRNRFTIEGYKVVD